MKKDMIGLATILPDNFTGTTINATGSTLTLSSINKAVRYLQSKKYQKEWERREKLKGKGQRLIGDALYQGIITIEEYMQLLMGIGINGMLIVNSKMAERLKKVKPRKITNYPKRKGKNELRKL